MRVQPLCRFAQQEGPHNFSSYRYRHLVIVVSLILLAFCGPVAALALSWHDGEGPYYISTAEELAELASLVNGGNNFSGRAIRLSEDIDLSGYENWTPIGSSLTQFLGEFDGREHAVFNMKAVGGVNTGLFGYAGNGAKIRNLDLVDFSIQSTSSSSNNTGVGCLVGYNGGAVENVSSNGVITGSGYIGGLVGWNSVAGTVSNSNARVEVTGTSTTGGLVGQNYGVISDCAATGSAASTGNGAGIGGLVGANNGVYSKISNSATNTRVKGGTLANIGGLAGYNGGYVSGSAANGEVGVSGAFESPKAGGLVGDNIGSVADSAASGNITVAISIKTYDTHIGGLIGDNKSESKSHYIVSNNAASGNVSVNYSAGSSRMYVGGFIGNNESGILSRDNVYDRQAAAQNAGMGYNVNASGGVKGATTAELTPSPQDASSNLGDSWTASKWTFFQGHYPQPRPLAESANPLARRISAIASAPVLFGNSTDTSRNMTVPFRVPRATAGTLHANLQWTQDEQRTLKFYSKRGDDKYWHAGWGQIDSDKEVALTATDALGCTKE
ncbi:MAG: hypothetical protein LBT08_07580, partial [Synergistaceae bacterium]|nr:hypothetical protein [Synergistaceae bacterium]